MLSTSKSQLQSDPGLTPEQKARRLALIRQRHLTRMFLAGRLVGLSPSDRALVEVSVGDEVKEREEPLLKK